MNTACREFRALLESELTRPGTGAELTPLSWHEHLLACEACKELLEAEEALELLLSSLPKPRLPEDLARRVLRRLRRARGAPSLDRLLDVDAGPVVPSGLSARVLSALAAERDGESEDALDRLLARDVVRVPADLAERVLASLEPERAPAPALPRWASTAGRFLVAAAAGTIVFLAAYAFFSEERAPKNLTELALADPALLEDFYVLDNWELLMPESDVELLVATTIEPADELALGLEEGE